MSCPRHPIKEIEEVASCAEAIGWHVLGGGAHAWGGLACPKPSPVGCRVPVYLAPRNPENHANRIRHRIDGSACQAPPTEPLTFLPPAPEDQKQPKPPPKIAKVGSFDFDRYSGWSPGEKERAERAAAAGYSTGFRNFGVIERGPGRGGGGGAAAGVPRGDRDATGKNAQVWNALLAVTGKRVYSFTLILAGVSEITVDMANALYEAGCDDASPGSCEGVVSVEFDRESDSLVGAIRSAVGDVERAGFKVTRGQVNVDPL